VGGAMQAQDEKLEEIRADPKFKEALARYVSGAPPVLEQGPKHTMTERLLAWYLARNNVPPATVLTQLKALAHQAYTQCVGQPPPQGTGEKEVLELGIKQVVMTTGMKLMSGTMGGLAWSTRSVDEIFDLWKQTQ
jgi:anaphase-promoting complex subunit 1